MRSSYNNSCLLSATIAEFGSKLYLRESEFVVSRDQRGWTDHLVRDGLKQDWYNRKIIISSILLPNWMLMPKKPWDMAHLVSLCSNEMSLIVRGVKTMGGWETKKKTARENSSTLHCRLKCCHVWQRTTSLFVGGWARRSINQWTSSFVHRSSFGLWTPRGREKDSWHKRHQHGMLLGWLLHKTPPVESSCEIATYHSCY